MDLSDKLTTIDLTPEQEKKWEDTRAALIWHCPAFTHIFYTMMHKNSGKHVALFVPKENEAGIPIAATDGSNIIIVPEEFFKLTLSERIFVVAHEIAHGIFGHVEMTFKMSMAGKVCYPDGKELGYDAETMNKAMDYVINDMLVESRIGTYNSDWLHDTTIATHQDSVLTAYRRIYQEQKKGGGGGQGQGSGTGGSGKGNQKGFDKHLKPGSTTGQDPAQAAAGRNDVEWKTAIAGAIASARAQGKLPAALDRALSDAIEPQIDWKDKIIGFFSRKPGGGTYDWRKPDRRLVTRNIIAPGRSGFGAGPVVCAIDTSGSVGQKELDLFFGELYGILDDVRPTKIFLMFCDAKVHRVDEVEDTSDLLDIRKQGAPGGGGTSFIPVFDKIAEMGIEPDALVYLTDGMGSFPRTAPSYPVLWGNIYPASKYPWGEVVDVPPVS